MIACPACFTVGEDGENLGAMIELGLGSVQSWECDTMGHLNVQHYVARASDSMAALTIPLGLGPRPNHRGGVTLTAVDHHIRFLKEMRPGAPFTITGGVLAVRDDRLVLYQEMRHTLTGTPTATFTTEAALVEMATRMPRPLPADLVRRAEPLLVTLPDHAAPKGLTRDPPRPQPTLGEADRLGLVPTQQSAVSAQDCDGYGFMATRAFMGRVSDAIPNMVAKTRRIDRSDGKTGGAALEYRFVYHATPREGDVLALRSGIKAIGDKTFHWVHWLFDLETGDAVATAEAVAVSFDLATRRALTIGEEVKRELRKYVVSELSV